MHRSPLSFRHLVSGKYLYFQPEGWNTKEKCVFTIQKSFSSPGHMSEFLSWFSLYNLWTVENLTNRVKIKSVYFCLLPTFLILCVCFECKLDFYLNWVSAYSSGDLCSFPPLFINLHQRASGGVLFLIEMFVQSSRDDLGDEIF